MTSFFLFQIKKAKIVHILRVSSLQKQNTSRYTNQNRNAWAWTSTSTDVALYSKQTLYSLKVINKMVGSCSILFLNWFIYLPLTIRWQCSKWNSNYRIYVKYYGTSSTMTINYCCICFEKKKWITKYNGDLMIPFFRFLFISFFAHWWWWWCCCIQFMNGVLNYYVDVWKRKPTGSIEKYFIKMMHIHSLSLSFYLIIYPAFNRFSMPVANRPWQVHHFLGERKQKKTREKLIDP